MRRALLLRTGGSPAARRQPKLVMLNPRTGATVGCQPPDPNAGSGGFLVSRACLSACQAHGFRPVPGMQSTGPWPELPSACTN